MKGAFIAAWLTGEALVIWRMVHKDHKPPVPGALLGITGLFVALGALAEFPQATSLAMALAWGLDVAAFMQVLPAGLGAQVSKAQQSSAKAEGLSGTAGPGGYTAPPGTQIM